MKRLVPVLSLLVVALAPAPASADDFGVGPITSSSPRDPRPPVAKDRVTISFPVRRASGAESGTVLVRLPSSLAPQGPVSSADFRCSPWTRAADEMLETSCAWDASPATERVVTFGAQPQRPSDANGYLVVARATGPADPNPSNDESSTRIVVVRSARQARPPAAPPRAGRSQQVAALSGTVRLRRRGSNQWVELEDLTNIPDRSELDATRGVVGLRVAADRNGRTAVAVAGGGRFVLDQDGAARPMTTLALSERLTGCRPASRAAGSPEAAARTRRARRRGKRSRRLWVEDRGGRWRTRGSYASATVVGTKWTTADGCRATTVRVALGTVRVRDLVRRRTVTVRAGRRYTARARTR